MIIIETQFIEKIILGLCREPKGVINLKLQFCYKVPWKLRYEWKKCLNLILILLLVCGLILDIVKKNIVSIFYWKLPLGAEREWLEDLKYNVLLDMNDNFIMYLLLDVLSILLCS